MPRDHESQMRLYGRHGERYYLNASEREAFRRVALTKEMPVQAFCLVLLHTGCRLSEARTLKRKDVQLAEGIVSITTLKQRRGVRVREVPIPPELVASLRSLNPEGRGYSERRIWPISRTTAWRQIKAVMAEAGIVGAHASPKGLRHGFGVACVMAGVPVFTVSRWLGHARLATTLIYCDVCGPEEKRLAERVWSLAEPPRLSA